MESKSAGRARRAELAAFLNARRAAMQPEDLGLTRSGRRRVSGLRRHEIADAAGVSVTWYTWLEQGRDIRTTPQVIDGLARAFRLDADAHRHLRRLSGRPLSSAEVRGGADGRTLTALVDALLPHPAHLMDPVADLLAWNRSYSRLFTDPARLAPEHRNGLWIQLMCDEVRTRLDNWERQTQHTIARFRAEAGKYPGDTRFGEVIEMLDAGSELFRRVWGRHEVHGFAAHLETIRHPDVGAVNARIVQLRPLDHPNLTLMVHFLDGEDSTARMSALLAA